MFSYFRGLTRYFDSEGKIQDIWIDGSTVTYNAWQVNQIRLETYNVYSIC